MTRPAVLALIPARGGSKSIPRKNLLPVRGRPLIAYTIDHALACASITRVIVSTDDEEIARVAVSCGAEVPFMRPAHLAQDLSPDIDVFDHALRWLATNENYVPDLIVHLRPTGALRRVAVIEQAIAEMLATPEADSLRSVSPASQSPYKMWRRQDGFLQPLLFAPGIREAHSMPRQLLPDVFWQNGYVDITRPGTIRSGSMTGSRVLPFSIADPIVELDYPDDVPRLEAALQSHEVGTTVPSRRWAV